MKGHSGYFILVALLLTLTGCRAVVFSSIKPRKAVHHYGCPPEPDYGYATAWYLFQQDTTRLCDVFYVHPTTSSFKDNWNTAHNHPDVIAYTQHHMIDGQVAAFGAFCNTIAPKYRQATFYSFIDRKGDGDTAITRAGNDVLRAFKYYWENINKGQRPFILAGHSQGTVHCLTILAEMKEDSLFAKNLVWACLPGWPITHKMVEKTGIIPCQSSSDNACMVSWNTTAKGAIVHLDNTFSKGQSILCHNPVSWSQINSTTTKEEHLGARFVTDKSTKVYTTFQHYLQATVDEGRLIINKPFHDKALLHPLGWRNYHFYDYHFFYYNIRASAESRVETFYSKKSR